jgi:PAS domain-containing protein
MANPSDTITTTGIRQRRPRAGERTRGGADALQTKIAVDLQNLGSDNYQQVLQGNIAQLPDAAGCDAAFLALISDDGCNLEPVFAAKAGVAQCTPEVLGGERLEDWPWLVGRLGHLKVIEIDDTTAGPEVATAELGRLAELHIGSALIIGVAVHGEIAGFLGFANEHGNSGWDVNLHLLIKLIGASLATGLERMRNQETLDELRERNDLIAMTANDGIWDFDGLTKHVDLSRRWKQMLGYDENDEDVLLDWYRLVHPDDMARVQSRMREHLEGKTPLFESVHRMKHQSGVQERCWTRTAACFDCWAPKSISPSASSTRKRCSGRKRARRSRCSRLATA